MKTRAWIAVLIALGPAVALCQRLAPPQLHAPEASGRDDSPKSQAVIATLHGKPIYADQNSRPEEAIWKQIRDAYLKEHKLSTTPVEVNDAIEHWMSQVSGADQEQWKRYFRAQLRDEETLERARLEMDRWKFDSTLYHQYKGRVCLSPAEGTAVPVEARIKLLEEYEAKKLLEIVDPNLREHMHRLAESRSWDIPEEWAEFHFSKSRWFLTMEEAQEWQQRIEQLQKAGTSSVEGLAPTQETTLGVSEPDQAGARQSQAPEEDVEPAEPPQFAARTFNSDLKLEVWFQEAPLSEPQRVGATPSPSPLQIPACWQWWVNAYSALTGDDWEPLVREMVQKEIPGLRDFRCGDAQMKDLARLTKLRLLRLPASTDDITDAGLVHLKGLTQLQVLELGSMWGVTDVGLAHLKGLTALQVLEVNSRAVTDKGLAHLEGLTGLQVLKLDNVTDAGLVHLRGLRELRELSLHGTGITDAGLPRLGQLSKLRILLLDGAQISEVGLAHLRGLTRLQKLDVGGYGVTDAALAQIRTFAHLRDLELGHTRISDAGLAHLRTLTKLESLGLYHAPITGAGLGYLKNIHSLQQLNLLHSDITDVGLARLEDLTGLRDLCLRDTLITDGGLVHLRALTNLQELDLWGTEVTDAGLVHLGALASLRKLELSGTDVTDDGLAHLKTLTRLESLRLTGTHVTRAGVKDLRQSLPDASIWTPTPGENVERRRP